MVLAVAGGLAGSVATFYVLGTRKAKAMQDDARAQLREGGRIDAMRDRLSEFAQQRGAEIAEAAARSYLSNTYGLTQDRIQKLERLGRLLGR